MRGLYLFVILLFLLNHEVPAQALFNNNGANIYVMDGALVTVTNNANNPNTTGSLYNNVNGGQGQISNEGTIVVEGYVKNDAVILGNGGNGDTIRLTGDWINDQTYTGNNSWVDMFGDNELITGTAITTFDNLNLGGPASAVKKQTLNAITAGLLQVNAAELATDTNEMLVTNTNTSDITWSTGFVSSLGPGKLSRATNVASAYIFPTGSPSYNNGPSIFRPIQMTPVGTGPDVYSVCCVKGNATNDGYNVESLDDSLCRVNPNFYHRLYHGSGADAAALTMYFDPGTDGDWTDEAHWYTGRWNYISPATPGQGLGFSTLTIAGLSNFTPNPFALAHKKFSLFAGPDVQIDLGQSTVLNPIIGAQGNPTITWLPNTALSCDNCADPTANPVTNTNYKITVTDAEGCSVSDSLNVIVLSSGLLLPTAFSPNGDGMNDLFHVLNKNIAKIDLQVYNRWGELVYETTDWTVGWDGTYKGMKQDMDVFVWQCTYTFIGDTQARFAKGNVTLLR